MVDIPYVVDKILRWVDENYPEEIEVAKGEYEKEEELILETEEESIRMDFIAWLILERKLKKSYTPLEIYYNSKFDEINDDELNILKNLLSYKQGIFEVIKRKGKKYLVKDILFDKEFQIKTKDLTHNLSEGDIISTRIVPISRFNHIFYGGIKLYEEGVKEDILKEVNKIEEANNELRKHFIEYFKCYDPEFKDMKSAVDTTNQFYKWYNEKRRKELSEKGEDINIPKFEEAEFKIGKEEKEFERVGVVFTKTGICLVPFYGFIKDLFSGKRDNVPEYEDLFCTVIEDEGYIPDSALKELIENNKEKTIELFKEMHENVNNFDDVLEIIKDFRKNFGKKELPTLSLIDTSKEDYKEQINKFKEEDKEKVFKVKCNYCARVIECPKSMLNAEEHICEKCINKVENGRFQGFVKEVQSSLDKLGSIGEKYGESYQKGVNKLLKNINFERLRKFKGDIRTKEGIVEMLNEAFFEGDWQKQIEWTEKYGSEEQKKEDIPLLKKLMKGKNGF